MRLISKWNLLEIVVLFLGVFGFSSQSDVGQLPHCPDENNVSGLVLVSTIDGRLSAINAKGDLQWQVQTEPGSLLTSNIHNLELTNNGKWIRIIPSLTGSLYRFDGETIDPIPITAESLLKSSFKFSDDLVIAGGLEVHSYGVGFRTGKVFYMCTSHECTNTTKSAGDDGEIEVEDVLVVERSSQTVRAVESQSGSERWNFRVGHLNIKLPQASCANQNGKLFDWNITAIMPDGLLLASKYHDNVEMAWQYDFKAPIVRIWRWNGFQLSEVDLFSKHFGNKLAPAIYLGMHKRQLYIYESTNWQQQLSDQTTGSQSTRLAKIPWKPVSASEFITEDNVTALTIFYNRDYVNGHGYYLFTEEDGVDRKGSCENNNTIKIPEISGASGAFSLAEWWRELLVFSMTTIFALNLWFRSFARRPQSEKVIFVEVPSRTSSERLSESSDNGVFSSRYTNDFDTLRCLGKGGFGVVFEVKQKIDECHYAIKRITLPNEEGKRDSVMREVKALAKLEHKNIVRYFCSWVEKPPYGWQQEYDRTWVKSDDFTADFTTFTSQNNNEPSNSGISVDSHQFTLDLRALDRKSQSGKDDDDSFIVFDKTGSSLKPDVLEFVDESNQTDVVSYEMSRRSQKYKTKSLNGSMFTPLNPPVFLYIQMQLCQKQSLKEWLAENRNRQFGDILSIFKQILAAVEYVHMQGLIHRDLKPSNIFFSLDGQIKVGDFGLVKDVEGAFDSQHGSSPSKGHTKEVGTRLYMSPEQIDGQRYNYKVDIYSLGLIFFELLVYFSTDMERIRTLMDVRDDRYPKDFMDKYSDEHNLLKQMLNQLPDRRLTTIGIRARPPLNCCDSTYDKAYDFDLPKSTKVTV